MYRKISLAIALAALFPMFPIRTTAAEPTIDLRTVKYDDLMKEVRGHKGKVIVVDIWAQWCVPCKREFPGLVKLQKDYGKADLVAISVTIDKPSDTEARANVLKFLNKVQATDVVNLNLDEEDDFWMKKFDTKGPPVVYVFDRANRIALKLPSGNQNVDYKVIEERVKELLKK